MTLDDIRQELRTYDGPPISIMEVCGSHTAAISRLGIPSLLSPAIHLLSGPGCPVCVTPTSYIDRLCDFSLQADTCVVTFGDLLRVPGSGGRTLAACRAQGGQVHMVYSPFDVLPLARENPRTRFVFAAVGFETTTPAYALLLQDLLENRMENVRLFTALKTMPPVIDTLCRGGAVIDAFLAPGHVCSVTGWRRFEPLAQMYHIPFAVAGFRGPELLMALHFLMKNRGRAVVKNLYPAAVPEFPSSKTEELLHTFFEPCGAVWRGLGFIPGSGRRLRPEFARFDAGSAGLEEDAPSNPACRCGQVLAGRISPPQCPLYGKHCTPLSPQGACMVSEEGSCHQYLIHHRE